MAIACVSVHASPQGFSRLSQNSAAVFSLPQSNNVLWSWNFFNPWRSKVALGRKRSKVPVEAKICSLDGGPVLANA